MLWKHWKKLHDIYGDVFLDIHQKSIKCLEIGHQYVFSVRGDDHSSDKFTEVMTVPMGIVEIKLFTDYRLYNYKNSLLKRQYLKQITFKAESKH